MLNPAELRGLRRYFHIGVVHDVCVVQRCLESVPCHTGARELNLSLEFNLSLELNLS